MARLPVTSRALCGALALALLLAAPACKDSTKPPTRTPSTLRLSETSVTIDDDRTTQLSATLLDQNGQVFDTPPAGFSIQWSSADAAVASVSGSGSLSGNRPGQVQITATAGSLSASAAVTVRAVATAVQYTAGNEQSGTVATPLAQELAVRVVDRHGGGVSGVTVEFAVTGGNGSASPASIATDAEGHARTTWVLGTTAGMNTLEARAGGLSGSPTAFTATGAAGAPAALVKVSGDTQTGMAGIPLAQPLVVRVSDAHGNAIAGASVTWNANAGGSFSPAITTTNAAGEAQGTWRLGPATGVQAASASGAGSVADFSATAQPASGLVISAVSPDPIVPGQSATLTGIGFSAQASANRVTIGGMNASVTAATPTSLQIQVPALCRPAGSVEVRVTVGSEQSNALGHAFRPAQYVDLGVGEQMILRNPSDFCLHFAPSGAAEAYLIGVQSVTEVPSSLTPVTLRSFTAAAPAGSAWPAAVAAGGAARPLPVEGRRETQQRQEAPVLDRAEAEFLRRHRAAEVQLREWERRYLAPRSAEALVHRARQGGAMAASAVPANLQVGDVVPIRVPSFGSGNLCTSFTSIQAVVRTIGTRGIWVEDLANPSGGFTSADIQAFSQFFDSDVYAPITEYFGVPTDIDNNQRVLVVLTREVNRVPGLGGFVSSGDLFPRSTCASSNGGEYYYGFVPDPTGSVGAARTRESVIAGTKLLIPHEVTHIIQLGRRMQVQGQWQSTWELEGQATLAEEITGHHISGRRPGQNYGSAVAWNSPPSMEINWYRTFSYLAQYFGFESSASKVPNAPEQCTFLGGTRSGNNGPCINGDFNYYGASWSFLRWLSDQFGPGFPGGEKGLHRALVEHRQSGFATISGVVGRPMDELLAQWAAALYVDDRIPEAQPRLTMTSWNLLDVIESRVASAHLQPRQRTFSAFSDPVTVRGGSTAYFRVSGSGRPATAISARTAADAALPVQMRVWVVRLQ